MVRKLNDDVRVRLERAACEVFAEAGYRGATMATIAARAEVSTGNIYRYFADKDALFYAVLPDEFAARFLRLVRRRVNDLAATSTLTAPDTEAKASAEALLGFWVENRLAVITLLDRAHGSRHEGFAARFVDTLMRETVTTLEAGRGGAKLDRAQHLVLTQIFTNTVRTIVAILEAHTDEAETRRAFAGFWSHQLAGLAGFSKWVES